MDFGLPEKLIALQREAEAFARREFDPTYAMECEVNRRYPDELHRKAGQAGLIGVHFPAVCGGRDAGLLGSVLVTEALCRRDSGLGMSLSLCALGSHVLLRHGSAEQKDRILSPVAAGTMKTAIALTEPDHGSDIGDLDTTAVPLGGEFVVDGVKTLISNGRNSQAVLVLAKTDPEARPPHRGMSFILVETDRPGFAARDMGIKMGLQMMSTGELSFRSVRAPASNLVGELNRGFYHALEFLNLSRVEVAAQALGCAQGALDRSIARVKARRQFGQRLADLQVVQHAIADMATKVEAARLLTYRAAWSADQGRPDPMLSSMAKLHAARAAVEVAEMAVQLHGGFGYFLEGEVERIYRDVRVTEIYEGTREIQKNTIAGLILDREQGGGV